MKVIVDNCVWLLELRHRDHFRLSPQEQRTVVELREAIQDRRASIIDPIRQEVLSGIRDKTQFA